MSRATYITLVVQCSGDGQSEGRRFRRWTAGGTIGYQDRQWHSNNIAPSKRAPKHRNRDREWMAVDE